MLLAALLFPAAAPLPVPPCHLQIRHGDSPAWQYLGDRSCVKFEPPRIMEGTWLFDVEASTFYDHVPARSGAEADYPTAWFNPDEPLKPFVNPARDVELARGRLYRVRFVGRRSLPLDPRIYGGFGHMGSSRTLVLLDEMLSIEDMGPLRPGPTQPSPSR